MTKSCAEKYAIKAPYKLYIMIVKKLIFLLYYKYYYLS